MEWIWALRLLEVDDKFEILIFTSKFVDKSITKKLHISGGGLSCIEMQGGDTKKSFSELSPPLAEGCFSSSLQPPDQHCHNFTLGTNVFLSQITKLKSYKQIIHTSVHTDFLLLIHEE